MKAAIFGAREAFKAHRPDAADPGLGLAAAAGRQDAARHRHPGGADHATALDVDVIGLNCSTGPEDMRDAIRYLGETLAPPGPLHPERRPAAPGPRRRDDLPRAARADSPRPSASSSSATASASSAAAAAPRPSTSARSRERVGGRNARRAPRARAAAGLEHDDRDAAGAGAAPDAGRRAGQLAGLAQGQGAAARRRLRRPRPGRRGPGRRRRPRARRLRRADRAPGRGRPDARGRRSASR